MSDQFHTNSVPFKIIPWRTDILCTFHGLEELKGIPGLSVSEPPVWFDLTTKSMKGLFKTNEKKRIYFMGCRFPHS
jgi:hypothetical protein